MARFKPDEFKTHLKMAQIRMTQSNSKRHNMNQAARREIATLLAKREFTRAEIKTETVVRETYIIEAYEILIDLLELCVARVPLIARESICPPALVMHISTIVWASSYVEIPDFALIRTDCELKFGKQFVQDALANSLNNVNPKVIARLSCMIPERTAVHRHMMEICAQYDVAYNPDDFAESLIGPAPPAIGPGPGGIPPPPPGHGGGGGGGGIGVTPTGGNHYPGAATAPLPTTALPPPVYPTAGMYGGGMPAPPPPMGGMPGGMAPASPPHSFPPAGMPPAGMPPPHMGGAAPPPAPPAERRDDDGDDADFLARLQNL